jgi:hypothetical protein
MIPLVYSRENKLSRRSHELVFARANRRGERSRLSVRFNRCITVRSIRLACNCNSKRTLLICILTVMPITPCSRHTFITTTTTTTMTVKKEDEIDTTKPYYNEEAVVEAVPAGPATATSNEPPIPAGHSRFYCSKCHTVRHSMLLLLLGFLYCASHTRFAAAAAHDNPLRDHFCLSHAVYFCAFMSCHFGVLSCFVHAAFAIIIIIIAVRSPRQGNVVAMCQLHGIQFHHPR